MALIKVLGGTAKDEFLCRTCRSSHIMGTGGVTETVICNNNWNKLVNITRKVTACNGYSDRRQIPLSDLEEIAWTVTTDKSGAKVGFKPPEKT